MSELKRSDINRLVFAATNCFCAHGWSLPPKPRWDVTDFGLGDWRTHGLVLINLAEEPEYCEKLMYAQLGMTTPAHCHRIKKEDIICRWGRLRIQLWSGVPGASTIAVNARVNGVSKKFDSGATIDLGAGERITLIPGVFHEFVPTSGECIIGEVSTANDDLHDNIFAHPDVGRYSLIEEDDVATVRLVSDL